MAVVLASPAQDDTLLFNIGDAGVSKAITNWGYDTGWNNLDNIQRSIIFMGTNVVNCVRVGPATSSVLTNGSSIWNSSLSASDQLYLSNMVNEIYGYTPNAKWYFACGGVNTNWYNSAAYRLYPDRFAAMWAANVRFLKTLTNAPTIPWIDMANEPDYSGNTTEGSAADYFNTLGYLQTNSDFTSKLMGGCATLNSDLGLTWFNPLMPRATLGSIHNLAGSAAGYVNFIQAVAASSAVSFEPEVHNVGECIVGANYGLNGVIWWGAAELARGQFAQACQGSRLGYSEDLAKWTAAVVYRAPGGKVQAFAGAAERTALTTTYRFFSKDRDVFYDGDGPRRDYNVTLIGSPTYGAGNDNERVVNITWGADVQPAINGRYIIVNRNSGKVLEVPGASTNNGVQLDQNTYTGALNQQWDVNPIPGTSIGDLSYYTVKAAHDGVTMDLNAFAYYSGAPVQQWNGGTNVVEQWYFQYTSNGWFKIKSRWSGKLVAVNGASTANGAVALQWDDTGTLDQQWRFIPATVASYDFVAPATVTGVSATANAVSVRLNWTASAAADLAGYTVLRSTTNGGPYEIVARGLTTNTFTDKFANETRTYYYVVKAVDKSLNSSGNSAQVSATPTGGAALIARYAFDGNLSDSSVNANHPIVTNGTPLFPASLFGSALDLDGASQYTMLPANLLAGVSNFTIAVWVNWDGGGDWQRIFDFGNDTTQYLFLTPRSGNGTLRFALKNGGGEEIVETSVLPTNQWRHVTITSAGGTCRLYTNGVLAASASVTITPASFNPALNYLGKSQYPDPLFNGRLDDLFVYNYALSDSEVLALANATPYLPAKLGGTIIGSAGSFLGSGNTITNVFDGNTNTYYDAANASGDWAGLDLGTAQVIKQVRYCPRSLFSNRMVGGVFQGANVADFSSGVVTLFTVAATPPEGVMTSQLVTDPGSYRYVRYLGPANAYCNAAEIEFYQAGTPNPPAAPTALTATAGNSQVRLSWGGIPSATSYNVKRSATSGGPYTTIATVLTTTYTNTGLVNGNTYYYVVSTSSIGGEGTNSTQVSVTPVSLSPPQVVFGITGQQMQLSWPADHVGWRLESQTNSLTSSNWFTVPGAASTNQISIPIDTSRTNVFFRLAYP